MSSVGKPAIMKSNTATKPITKVKLRSTRRRYLILLAISLFGCVGVYALFRSQAAIPEGQFWGAGGPVIADYSVYADTDNPDKRYQAGLTFSRNYYLHFPQDGAYPQTPHHIQFYLRWYTEEVDHLESKFVCGGTTPCVKIAEPEPSAPEVSNLIVCFDITPAMRNQGNVKLFSTMFKQLSTSGQNWQGDLLYLFSGECTGYYENGPPANDPNYLAFAHIGNGGLGGGLARPAKTSDSGDSGNNNSGEGSGNGEGAVGSSGGGGGSGRMAKTESNEPDSLPKTSSQGYKKQPELQPSPFFDGKQYTPGSAPDNRSIGSILSSSDKTIAKGWPFAIGAVAVAGTGFAIYWRLYRK